MPWFELFPVFVVSHLVGDFVLQTEWQASTKRAGLGSDPASRRALLWHVLVYMLAFVPALIWMADDLGAGVLAVAALVAGPHLVLDDGRLVERYVREVKRAEPAEHPLLLVAVDQSLHLVALFLVALVASG